MHNSRDFIADLFQLFRAKLFTEKLGSNEISNFLPPWAELCQAQRSPSLLRTSLDLATHLFGKLTQPAIRPRALYGPIYVSLGY